VKEEEEEKEEKKKQKRNRKTNKTDTSKNSKKSKAHVAPGLEELEWRAVKLLAHELDFLGETRLEPLENVDKHLVEYLQHLFATTRQ
jgi:hypothetical protein